MGSVDNLSGFGVLDARPEAKLRSVIEITRSLAGCIDLKALLPRILDTLFGIFPHLLLDKTGVAVNGFTEMMLLNGQEQLDMVLSSILR